MEAAGQSDRSLRFASDTRWYGGARPCELARTPEREYDVPPGGIAWLSFYEPREGELSGVEYYDIAPVAERLETLGLDVLRPGGRGRTHIGRALTGLFAPKLGHQGTGVFTALGVEVDTGLAQTLGAFTCVRAARISLIAIPGCLVTVRHRPVTWIGRRGQISDEQRAHALAQPIEEEPFAHRARLQQAVEREWMARPELESVPDLTLQVLRVLSGSLQPAIGYLTRQLDDAEQVYFEVLAAEQDRLDDAALRDGQRNLFELAGVLSSFTRELAALTDTIAADSTGWIMPEADQDEARRVVQDYRDALTALRDLRQDLRTSVDMTASTLASRQLVVASRQEERAREQLRLAEEQRDRNDRFMRDATLIASLVLLPTLVATVYGANVGLPLRDRAAGTIVMLVVMLVAAFAAWQALRLRYPRGRR